MDLDPDGVRRALIRQWALIATAVGSLDLATPSRIDGWRNREVVAHLAMQPSLLVRFIRTTSHAPPEVSLAANLAGTRSMAEMIDASVHTTDDSQLAFGERFERARPVIETADLAATVTTLQGPIALVDYLRTRCVEAVVHGLDLVPPVTPDGEAVEIAAAALVEALGAQRPDLVGAATDLPLLSWIDQATGRAEPSPPLAGALPVMS